MHGGTVMALADALGSLHRPFMVREPGRGAAPA